jgi:pilus assembly protein CpaC
MFKEFGIRLNFTPTVLGGDLINLKVRPEVSALDFSNAITLGGFRVPALSTRRTETEVELRDGQTFAIAGLMNNTVNSTMSKIPGIGDIPILGLLFQSKAHQKNQTELVVMITPQILPRSSTGVTGNLPRTPEQFLPPMPERKLIQPLPPAFTPSRQGFTPPSGSGAAAAGPAANTSTTSAAESATAEAVKAAIAAAAANAAPVAAAPAPAPTPAAAAPAPMTSSDKKAQEKAQKQAKAEQEKQAKLDKENQERQAKLAKAQEKADQERQVLQAKAAREQAKRDADAARKQQK